MVKSPPKKQDQSEQEPQTTPDPPLSSTIPAPAKRRRSTNNWRWITRAYLSVLMIILTLVALWQVRDLWPSLMLSALLAFLLNTPVTWVKQLTKCSHQLASTIVFTLFITAVIVPLIIFGPAITAQLQSLLDAYSNLETFIIENLGVSVTLADNIVLDFTSISNAMTLVTDGFIPPNTFWQLIQATWQTIFWLILILATTFYLLRDWSLLREWFFAQILPAYRSDARRLYQDITLIWQAYLIGQLMLMTAIGVLTTLGLLAVGLPRAVAIGIMAGVLDLIPSAGPAVAMVVGTIVAFFQGSTLIDISNGWFSLLVLTIFVIIQTLENVWLRPRIIGYQLRLHPAVVFAAVMISLTLFSILLTLLIVPLIGTALVLGRYARARLFNLPPWPEDEEPVMVELDPPPLGRVAYPDH
ncbi:MAG TPA: AI-2E family transporter [Anaerolineae bacterium]|nr:AI-2E family transporter [Anaerolineae bacterium]